MALNCSPALKMRSTLCLTLLLLSLMLAAPASAQLRQDLSSGRSSAKLFESGASGFLMNTLFNPQNFKMAHSYEMSMSSFGGGTTSMGMYTNSMMWQFSEKVAGRVDVSVAHSLFGNTGGLNDNLGMDTNRPQVFLRNAELAYRPTKNVQLHLQIQNSPYGSYMSPYGYYSPYGYSSGLFRISSGDELFWKDAGK